MTLNLPGKPYLALSGTIWNPVESVIWYYPESGIQWNVISGYIRYPESGKKVYPVHSYPWAIGYAAINIFNSGDSTNLRLFFARATLDCVLCSAYIKLRWIAFCAVLTSSYVGLRSVQCLHQVTLDCVLCSAYIKLRWIAFCAVLTSSYVGLRSVQCLHQVTLDCVLCSAYIYTLVCRSGRWRTS